MPDFFEIKCLSEEESIKLLRDIEERIAAKLKDGTFAERDIRDIKEMRLQPQPDIQDVQSVYEDHLYRKKI